MKKCLTFFLFSFLIYSNSYATSGACSSHNGVNCEWTNSFKSVICNDGETESTTSYFDLVECKNLTSCTPGAVTALLSKRGLLGSSFGSAALSNCSEINNSNPTSNTTIQNKDYSALINTRLDKEVAEELAKICITKIGNNSKYNYTTKKCECGDNHVLGRLTGQCVDKITEDARVDVIFQNHFDVVIKRMPEYQSIVDKKVIKELSLKSENGNKTLSQIIVETYSDKLPVIIPATLASSTIENQFIFTRSLKKGMQGEDVKQLQILLKKIKYLPPTHIPSLSFGNITLNAIIKFQKDNRIYPAQGFVGAETRKKILEKNL